MEHEARERASPTSSSKVKDGANGRVISSTLTATPAPVSVPQPIECDQGFPYNNNVDHTGKKEKSITSPSTQQPPPHPQHPGAQSQPSHSQAHSHSTERVEILTSARIDAPNNGAMTKQAKSTHEQFGMHPQPQDISRASAPISPSKPHNQETPDTQHPRSSPTSTSPTKLTFRPKSTNDAKPEGKRNLSPDPTNPEPPWFPPAPYESKTSEEKRAKDANGAGAGQTVKVKAWPRKLHDHESTCREWDGCACDFDSDSE
ncbi:MAG: hypothetical protein M1828_000711 [Chrysothrix sp. TS-e1954]|nr:MAG: hypothetical protein M1828_000711 [Chrysothrix sp. TS-e1954]